MKRLCDQARKINAIKRYEENPSFCKTCGEKITIGSHRLPSDAKRMQFCSRSCAAIWNNIRYPKRDKDEFKTVCGSCGKKKSYGSKTCQWCKRVESLTRVWNSPIKKYYGNGASRSKYTNIRKWAKIYMIDFDSREKKCEVCGYSKVVEVAHKKSISTFEGDELMSVVNDKNNLIWLCPNHHEEFDNGLLELDENIN